MHNVLSWGAGGEEHRMNELYKDLFYHLFNRITDALEAIKAQNYGLARDILMEAQRASEEKFISSEQ